MDYDQAIGAEVDRLFDTFERGVGPGRRDAYKRALHGIPLERLERAVDWTIETWKEKSPPNVATLREVAWKGAPGATTTAAGREADQDRLRELRYYLERFSMADWYEFKRAFGYTPTAALYEKLAIRVPDGVTFAAPDPALCMAERQRAQRECRAAFHELGAKHGARMPEPDRMARVVRDEQARAANAELPF